MKKAVFPGSFDPITLGHIDIIRRLASVFDEVTVLVADSTRKKYLFDHSERLSMVKECVFDIARVKVDSYQGLTTQYAIDNQIKVMVRSMRGPSDWETEATLAQANKKLSPQLETFFVATEPQFSHISSTLVKEIAYNNGSLKEFVPTLVEKAIKAKLKGRNHV